MFVRQRREKHKYQGIHHPPGADTDFMKLKKGLYKCTQCDYSSKTSHSIREHMAKHTGLDYFMCLGCHKTFPSHYQLTNHIKRFH